MSSRNSSLALWEELADPQYEPSSSEDRPSSVPSESQRAIRKRLRKTATEWLSSAGEPKENDDGSEDTREELSVFTRTQGQGYPAAWIGGGVSEDGSFKGVILCTELFCLPEPLYTGGPKDEFWKQALVGVDNGDVVLYVEGSLSNDKTGVNPQVEHRQVYPSALDLKSIQVDGRRVTDRQKACSSQGENAVEEVENPRRIFFKLLRDHPKIADGLSSEDHDGQYFVANEGETPSTAPCEGTVKVFFDEDGYGFIETEKVEEDVFFLEKDANGETLSGGERIQFDLAESIRRPRALDLEVLERNRKKGIVDWFSEKEGYGFIEPRDRDSDNVFVHKNDVKGGPLSEGEPVEFSVRMESKGPKATAVERIPK